MMAVITLAASRVPGQRRAVTGHQRRRVAYRTAFLQLSGSGVAQTNQQDANLLPLPDVTRPVFYPRRPCRTHYGYWWAPSLPPVAGGGVGGILLM